MCGIAGFVTRRPLDRPEVVRVSRAIAHRGPDAEGCWQGDGLTLIHRRLSIVDIDHGQQPMISDDGRLVVVFNGEIYNFPELRRALERRGKVFRTRCDTEVLLHLYAEHGPALSEHLRGMFAFAIWDRDRRQLVLSRDHLGQKPLFFWRSGDAFGFASEVKALFASGLMVPAIDFDALWHHGGLRFCPGDLTLFRGVQKLRPAQTLVFRPERGEVSVRRYWNLDYTAKGTIGFGETLDTLEALIDRTVEMHLQSDVPVGSFLSGGVDSSTIAALAAKHAGPEFPTFSIGVGDGDFSELPFARRASEVIHSRHHEFKVEADLMLLLPDVIWHLEEPGDPHAVGVYLLSRMARPHVKVALGGDGGDEAFGGYTRFTRSPVLSLYGAIPRPVRNRLLAPLIRLLPESYSYYSPASKARWVHAMSMCEGAARQLCALTFFRFPEADRARLFTSETLRQLEDRDTVRWIAEHHDSRWAVNELDRIMYTEQMTRMPEHDLRIGDRMSMAHGLELRAPLVDYRVAEFAATLPAAFKARPGKLKIILRELAKRYYPAELIDREKRGFGFPMARWYRGPLAGFIRSVMNESRFLEAGIFDRGYVDAVLREHQSGKIDHNFKIWNLLNLEIWYRLFLAGESRDDVREWLLERLGRGGAHQQARAIA